MAEKRRPNVLWMPEGARLHTVVHREALNDGRTVYVATCMMRRGCMAHGDTVEEAVANLEESRVLYDQPTPAAEPARGRE